MPVTILSDIPVTLASNSNKDLNTEFYSNYSLELIDGSVSDLGEDLEDEINMVLEDGFNMGAKITHYDNFCNVHNMEEFLDVSYYDVSILCAIFGDNSVGTEDFMAIKFNFLSWEQIGTNDDIQELAYNPNCEASPLPELCCESEYFVSEGEGGFYYNYICELNTESNENEWVENNLAENELLGSPGSGSDNVWNDGGNINLDEMSYISQMYQRYPALFSSGVLREELEAGLRIPLGQERFSLMATPLLRTFFAGDIIISPFECDSRYAMELFNLDKIQNQIMSIQSIMINHYDVFGSLELLFSENLFLSYGIMNSPPLNEAGVDPLWALAILGGTQGLKIDCIKFEDLGCSQNPPNQVKGEIIYELYGTFGAGSEDGAGTKSYLPGLAAFWVLQHYRNEDCPPNSITTAPCNVPVVYSVKVHHEFTFMQN